MFQLLRFIPEGHFLFFWFAAVVLSFLCCGDQFALFCYALVVFVSNRHGLASSAVECGGSNLKMWILIMLIHNVVSGFYPQFSLIKCFNSFNQPFIQFC